MPSDTYIYGLLCPRENKIRYVGKADDPVARLKQHLVPDKPNAVGGSVDTSPAKRAWIDELLGEGIEPQLVILEVVEARRDVWRATEHKWIERLSAAGHPLTNREAITIQRQTNKERILQEALDRGRKIAEAFGVDPSELVK